MSGFEVIGAIVVGLTATTIIVVTLQIAYETWLSFVGYRRAWICRHRFQGKLTKPFPMWRAIWAALRWKLDIGGNYVMGALRVPADPRKPIYRKRWY